MTIAFACSRPDAVKMAPSSFDAGPNPLDATGPRFGLDVRPTNTACKAFTPPPSASPIKLIDAFPNLPKFSAPDFVVQAPGDRTRFYVVQQEGTVIWFDNDPLASENHVFADIKGRVVYSGERGLLGLAFHPNWATNHEVFLSYTGNYGDQPDHPTVSRYVASADGQTVATPLEADEDKILDFDHPSHANHNGGMIAFGPDGYLYFGMGDGGGAGDPNDQSQNKDLLFGKILRIDPDHAADGKKYGIPSTNPFANGGGAKEIYALGFRNPWRWSFDTTTGDFWVGDVGENLHEEIDKVTLGGNYGWNIREGSHCFDKALQIQDLPSCDTTGLIDPVVNYDHSFGAAVIGGYVYRGSAIPSLQGTYLYADLRFGELWGLTLDPSTGQFVSTLLLNTALYITSLAQDLDGEVYVVSGDRGKIFKVVPNDGALPIADAGTLPALLSQTGCVDAFDPKKPADGVIPYNVNSPLWSDAASKERYFAIPDGSTIHVNADGDWDMPIGTVFMKTFSAFGKRVETRFLMRDRADEWSAYNYEWNDAETDATLLVQNKTRDLGSGKSWYYPAREECFACHTSAAGRSLGAENAQLNGTLVYPSGVASNQLATLDHIGMFDTPVGDVAHVVAYPVPTSMGDPGDRARSYLHANCSFCHRPNGGGGGSLDLRYATPWSDVMACNAKPLTSDLGLTDAGIVVPGDPSLSILSLRMGALNGVRMPPLASRVVDAEGVKIIDDWILGLTGCSP